MKFKMNLSNTTLRTFKRQPSNKDTILASGDNVRSCRLCGADYNLKFFKDTYLWEGVEEKYDQLLFDCFGVTVSPTDCMICEWCIRALRNTERFRALVHAAFDITGSNSDLISKDLSSVITLVSHSCQTTSRQTVYSAKNKPQIENKSAVKDKITDGGKLRIRSEIKKVKPIRNWMRTETNFKRINVYCNICSQRYPMVVLNEESTYFVCSRCKKNKEAKVAVCNNCNIVMPKNMVKEHMDLHVKADLRGKTRLRYSKKKLSPSPTIIIQKQTYQCTKCAMKYNYASHLASHVRHAHGDDSNNLSNGGQYLVTREKCQLGQLSAPKLIQREECQLLFKNKKALYSNSLANSRKKY